MITYRIKRHYSVIPHSPDIVELRSGAWNPTSFTVTDDSGSGTLFRIIRRFDGTVTVSEISKQEKIPKSEVQALLDHLLELGVVESEPSSALDHYLDALAPRAVGQGDQVWGSKAVVLLGDPALTDRLHGLLGASAPELHVEKVNSESAPARLLSKGGPSRLADGLQFHQDLQAFREWEGRFVVAVDAVLNPARLLYLNRILMHLGISWLHAVVDLPFLVVGPTFLPGLTPCYECFERRVMLNAREGASYERYKAALADQRVLGGRPPLLESVESLLIAHVALEVINFAATSNNFTQAKALTVHLPTMEFVFHEVLRMPNCSSCGSVSERDDTELYFDTSSVISARSGSSAVVGR